MVEGATPRFLPLVRHRGGVKGDRQNDTFTLPLKGGRSLHSDPCGKADEPMRRSGPPHRPQAVRCADRLEGIQWGSVAGDQGVEEMPEGSQAWLLVAFGHRHGQDPLLS